MQRYLIMLLILQDSTIITLLSAAPELHSPNDPNAKWVLTPVSLDSFLERESAESSDQWSQLVRNFKEAKPQLKSIIDYIVEIPPAIFEFAECRRMVSSKIEIISPLESSATMLEDVQEGLQVILSLEALWL